MNRDKDSPRLAIPVFRSRVAPVLNWCSRIYLFAEETEGVTPGQEIVLLNMSAFDRLRILHQEGIRTLICGALSPDLLTYGESMGLYIIYGIAGEIDEVIKAYHTHKLNQPCFWLPGCRGPRHYRKNWAKDCPEGDGYRMGLLKQEGEAGREEKTIGGTIKKRSTASTGSGPGGFCLCPKCGTRVSHERGIPCSQVLCPRCDHIMVRG